MTDESRETKTSIEDLYIDGQLPENGTAVVDVDEYTKVLEPGEIQEHSAEVTADTSSAEASDVQSKVTDATLTRVYSADKSTQVYSPDLTVAQNHPADAAPAQSSSADASATKRLSEEEIATRVYPAEPDATQYYSKDTVATQSFSPDELDTQVYTPEPAATRVIGAASDTRTITAADTIVASGRRVADGIGQGLSQGTDDLSEEDIEAIKARIRERKREKKIRARRRRIRFWTILSVILLSLGAFLFSISGFFTVDSIEVHGNERYTAEEIINIAHAVPGHNLLYNPDKKNITDYLEQNPYIKSAAVTRKLPSTLVITVNERKQACAFKYDDDYLVMDDEGILLKKTRTEPKITRVTGLVVTKIKLGEVVGTENPQMFNRMLKLIRAMKDADLYFVKLDFTDYEDEYKVRAYIYSKLVVKTDYDSLLNNLNNGRLHRIVEKLFSDNIKRGTITFGADGTASFEPGI